jgi:fibronectin type 3 domain-containing protein
MFQLKMRMDTVKKKWIKLAWAVMVLVLVFTACPNPSGGPDDSVDKTELTAAIANAAKEMEGVAQDTDPANVPLGTQWVTWEEWNALESALAEARGLNDNSWTTEDEVDAAVNRLNNAITIFWKAKKAGTATPVDKSALAAKIIEAQIAKDSAVQAESARSVAQGASWATSYEHGILAAAITAAESVRDTARDQWFVDEKVIDLNSAISSFTSAVNAHGPGTKASGFTQNELSELITKANAAKAGVLTSTDGSDVPPTGSWVQASALTALEAALTMASSNPTSVDRAYLWLSDELSSFNSSKKPGAVPDKQSLFTAVRNADAARTGVVIAASRGEAPLGSAWVTRDQWDALNVVYTASLTSVNEPGAAKNQVDTARRNLESAIAVFNAAKAANGLGTAENRITITGLQAIYNNGAKVYARLLDSKIVPYIYSTSSISPYIRSSIYGEGTVTNGSLTLALSDSAGIWGGSGSYYIAFTSDEVIVFISKEKFAFNGGTLTRTYTDFEPPVYSMYLGNMGLPSGMSMNLDNLIYLMTNEMDMPGGPYSTYESWKPAMQGVMQDMFAAGYVNLNFLDYTLYKNADCTQPYSGSDTINSNTMIYCRAPIYTGSTGTGSQLSAPTGLRVTGSTANGISLSWNSVSGASYYYVYRSDSASGPYSPSYSYSTSYNDSGLQADTTYYYRVSAVSFDYTESPQSEYVSGTTLSWPAPTGLQVTAFTSNSISLSWNSVSGASHYYVYRSDSASGPYSSSYSSSTSYNDSGLAAGTTYYYKVSAISSSSGSESPQSAYVSGTTISWPAPTGLQVTAFTSNSISLSWNSVSGASNYRVYRSNSETGTYSSISGNINNTSYTNSGLTAGTTYYYKVSAVSSNNTESPQSEPVSGTPNWPAPTGLRVTGSTNTSISLSWNSVSGASYYRVYRSNSETGTYSSISGNINNTSYTNSGLPMGTTYYYKVSATDSYGGSPGPQSASVSGTTSGYGDLDAEIY